MEKKKPSIRASNEQAYAENRRRDSFTIGFSRPITQSSLIFSQKEFALARILIVIFFPIGSITLLSDNASFFNQEPILKELSAATGSAVSDYKVANASYVKMYNQLQFMQEEFFRLQGKIEKLENEIKQLKKEAT